MLTTLVILFVLAYLAIALEHPLGVNKSASALSVSYTHLTLPTILLV